MQITSSLTHPNTVAVYDFGETPEGTLYYAMEYLSGVTLQDLVPASGPQTRPGSCAYSIRSVAHWPKPMAKD